MLPQLYQCLLATLDPNPATRNVAEAALEAGAKQPGFGATLVQIVLLQARAALAAAGTALPRCCLRPAPARNMPRTRPPAQPLAQLTLLLAVGVRCPLQEAPYGLRQLAAVVLKKHVKEHWTFESPHFREPPVEEGEKATIRELLPVRGRGGAGAGAGARV